MSSLTCEGIASPARPVTGADRVTYWSESRRPLASLLFVLPWLVFYEWGVWRYGNGLGAGPRSSADLWIRDGAQSLGVGGLWLSPVVLVGGLLLCHWLSKSPWRMRPATVAVMGGESLFFALTMVVLGQTLLPSSLPRVTCSLAALASPLGVGLVGAGLYEEVLFRMALIPPVTRGPLARWLRWPALAAAGLASSVVFAAAHYVPLNDPTALWNLSSALSEQLSASPAVRSGFLFRLGAGLTFAALYVFRGFGIAAGTHILYDLIVGIWLIEEL